MIKFFVWTSLFVLISFICALFLTEDLTRTCSDHLLVCLTTQNTLPFWDKMSGGFVCVLNNIGCVFSRPFM